MTRTPLSLPAAAAWVRTALALWPQAASTWEFFLIRKGEALAKELDGVGVTGSNREDADLQRLVDAAMKEWGRIDVLVNSAGHGPRADILELTDGDWREGMEVYFLSAVRPTRLVTPIMRAQGGGSIVNISTFAAFEPSPGFPTSGVMRAGLAVVLQAFFPTGMRQRTYA